jgi:hypothetical protein
MDDVKFDTENSWESLERRMKSASGYESNSFADVLLDDDDDAGFWAWGAEYEAVALAIEGSASGRGGD